MAFFVARGDAVNMGRIQDLLAIIRSKPDHQVVMALDELLPRWIPVEERLPDDGVRVMAWDRREQSWRIAYIDSIWHMVGFDDDTPICVSHWMPLPEPPEVK